MSVLGRVVIPMPVRLAVKRDPILAVFAGRVLGGLLALWATGTSQAVRGQFAATL